MEPAGQLGDTRAVRSHVVLLAALHLGGLGCRKPKENPSCTAVADHVMSLMVPADDYARDVREVFVARCEADKWPAAMRTCLRSTQGIHSPRNCKQQLSGEQAKRLDDDLAVAEQRQRARTLPPVCGQYEELLVKVATCDALPQDVRDSLAQKLAAAKQEWTTAPDKSRYGPICASALRAVRLAAASCLE